MNAFLIHLQELHRAYIYAFQSKNNIILLLHPGLL